MKIHVTGTVLTFNFADERFAKIEELCKKQGCKLKKVEKCDFSKPVGALVGFGVESDTLDKVDFDDELMLLYNFTGSELNKFLNTLRENNIEVPLKAMLTDTNKSWRPIELYEAIKQEHEQMKAAEAK